MILSTAMTGCGTSSRQAIVSKEPVRETYRSAYGRDLAAWIFDPETTGGRRAAILLFHGGGWDSGSPEWTFTAAERFRDHGMVSIAVEYRLSKGSVTPIDALIDVCQSFRWVRANSERLGIDPRRIAGYGVSAGGHLVAATATVGCQSDDDADATARPDLLLLWSPALAVEHDGWFRKLLQNQAEAEEYSPSLHVRSTTPPTSIVQGEKDTLTPISGSRAYCDRLREQRVECDLNPFEGVGHLLTRNLANQESDFDPDPDLVARGIEAHLAFLARHGFISK